MSARSNNLKIAIVEDSPTQAEQLRYILETNGYQVMAASNGREALALIKAECPDIVITDIVMPEMDGYELCRQIKKDEHFKKVPVILLTALSDPADVIKGLECGADNFVTKPYDEMNLISRIEYLRLNWRLPEIEHARMSIEITFGGQQYFITSDRLQILNLLLSTYESAVGKNQELKQAQTELSRLNEQLEQRVKERTAELVKTAEELELEIIERKRAQERIIHLNSVLRALRGINQLITREKDRDRLIRQSCELIVRTRGIPYAWVLLFDEQKKFISAAVTGGKETQPFYGQLEQEQYPLCVERILAQENSFAVCGDADTGEWGCLTNNSDHDGKGFISRLEYEGKTYGVISILLSLDYAQDAEEQSLFRELAGDVAYALHSIEREAEHKIAEENREIAERNFRNSLDDSPLGIRIVTADGDLIYANKAILNIFGFQSIDELKNTPMKELYTSESYAEYKARKKLRATGDSDPSEYEISIVRKDGEVRRLSVSRKEVVWSGETRFQSVYQDITEQRRMEEQLMVTDRLASIGELASGIAHEINNPLTGIIGLSEMVLDTGVPDDIKEDLQTVHSEAQRTAKIVQNLLVFARKHPLEKQLTNVNDIIAKVLELRAYEQKVNNIEVVTHLAKDLPEINGNYFQLQQVFINIIINAEFFMSEAHGRGTLTIRTRRIGDVVRVSFTNDGKGIDKKVLPHIFDPFFTTKDVGKGTGLGLSICHGIVVEHGGKIYAKSEDGKETTFTIELPVKS
jgi:PAS domain S-box-containing protein